MSDARSRWMTRSQWLTTLETVYAAHVSSAWDMADLVVQGLDTLTNGSPEQAADLLGEASEQMELSVKTLQNYARVARKFPPDLRWGPPLTLGHHECLLRLDPEQAQAWLRQAAESGWSVARLRLEVSAIGAPDEPLLPTHRLAIERAFYGAGVRAKVTGKRAVFRFRDHTLVVESDADLVWSVGDTTAE